MGELAFIPQPRNLPHPNILSCVTNMSSGIRETTSHPSVSAYPELSTPYSAVSSFNYPTRADPSLLTPISSSGSPPLNQDIASPEPNKMYTWSNQFDISGQSGQTSSSMAPQTTVAPSFMSSSYMSPERRPTPGPPEPYTGMYGVSDSAATPYYMNIPSVEHPSSDSMALEPDHDPSRSRMPSTPLVAGGRIDRRSADSNGIYTDARRDSHTMAPNRPRELREKRVRKPKPSSRKGAQYRNATASREPVDEHKNCHGQEEPPQLTENCPAEERCIFESRWRHRYKKGQDMWDSIQADFQRQFNKTHGKETLQMKFKRGRARYYSWQSEDENILRQAFVQLEKDRYQLLLERFLELGGSRNMQLSASDIECKVASDLKLEEGVYIDYNTDVALRRRRKLSTAVLRRRASRSDDGGLSPSDIMVTTNVSGDEVARQIHDREGQDDYDQDSSINPEMMDMQMPPSFVAEHLARQHRHG